MPQMTPSAARVVDPVLTSIAQGYKNSEMIASALFPTVNVPLRGGNIITFSKEDFMLYGSQRAPGENTRRVQFGYAGSPYALVDYGLEGQLPLAHLLFLELTAEPAVERPRRERHAPLSVRCSPPVRCVVRWCVRG